METRRNLRCQDYGMFIKESHRQQGKSAQERNCVEDKTSVVGLSKPLGAYITLPCDSCEMGLQDLMFGFSLTSSDSSLVVSYAFLLKWFFTLGLFHYCVHM